MRIRGRGEACVEALIFLEQSRISVLYLVHEHIIHNLKSYWVAVLVIELFCAVIVSIAFPPTSGGAVAPFLAPVLSLLFQATVLPVVVFALRVHLAKQRPNNAQISPYRKFARPHSLEPTTPPLAATRSFDVFSSSPEGLYHPDNFPIATFVAFVVEIAAVKVGLSTVVLNSEPSTAVDTSAYQYAILQIIRVALMVFVHHWDHVCLPSPRI
ncbi:hypothetical protein FA13DRAFT_1803106 [Coprinellus micaceus]|uniref:Uncharacterized protein n=1 Tax=Coprinellus micaceus TaxID=71717 RepID=A0A4Y7SAV2_COPMI|nr:hypothetical protein FA13DRAFT_1803106 [Coprinellus micaceus]